MRGWLFFYGGMSVDPPGLSRGLRVASTEVGAGGTSRPEGLRLHAFGPYLMNEIEHFLQLARTFCWNIATCETVFYAVPLQLKERQSKQISNATTFSASFMRRLSQLLRVLWKHQMQE